MHRGLIASLVVLLSLSFIIGVSYETSSTPGPIAPSTPSTQTLYCQDGKCSTGGTQAVTNSILNIYPPGYYSGIGGIHIPNVSRIALELTTTCLKMEILKMNSTCISYKDLIPFDNTDPRIAGQWVEKPYYHRGPSEMRGVYNFPTKSNFVVMADAQPDFLVKARVIWVGTNFTYINPDDKALKGGLELLYHQNRFVAGCSEATVAPIPSIINDTIHYMESGCTTTSYNDTQVNTHPDVPFSYDNPYSSLHYNIAEYHHDKYSAVNCITHKCKTPINVYHTVDSRFGW